MEVYCFEVSVPCYQCCVNKLDITTEAISIYIYARYHGNVILMAPSKSIAFITFFISCFPVGFKYLQLVGYSGVNA